MANRTRLGDDCQRGRRLVSQRRGRPAWSRVQGSRTIFDDRDLPLDAVVTREDTNLLTAEVDGELMGMSVEQGTCYGFNTVGTRIWHLLAEPHTLSALCARLAEEYEVSDDVCRQDVTDLVRRLRDEHLVKVEAP